MDDALGSGDRRCDTIAEVDEEEKGSMMDTHTTTSHTTTSHGDARTTTSHGDAHTTTSHGDARAHGDTRTTTSHGDTHMHTTTTHTDTHTTTTHRDTHRERHTHGHGDTHPSSTSIPYASAHTGASYAGSPSGSPLARSGSRSGGGDGGDGGVGDTAATTTSTTPRGTRVSTTTSSATGFVSSPSTLLSPSSAASAATCSTSTGGTPQQSAYFVQDMAQFINKELPVMQHFLACSRTWQRAFEHGAYTYLLNQCHSLTIKAENEGLRTRASLDYFRMAAWLCMAASEVGPFKEDALSLSARLRARDSFYERYRPRSETPDSMLMKIDEETRGSKAALGRFYTPTMRMDLMPPTAMKRLKKYCINFASASDYPHDWQRGNLPVTEYTEELVQMLNAAYDVESSAVDTLAPILWRFMAIYHVVTVFPHTNNMDNLEGLRIESARKAPRSPRKEIDYSASDAGVLGNPVVEGGGGGGGGNSGGDVAAGSVGDVDDFGDVDEGVDVDGVVDGVAGEDLGGARQAGDFSGSSTIVDAPIDPSASPVQPKVPSSQTMAGDTAAAGNSATEAAASSEEPAGWIDDDDDDEDSVSRKLFEEARGTPARGDDGELVEGVTDYHAIATGANGPPPVLV